MQKEGEVERYKIEKKSKKKTLYWQEDTKIQKQKKATYAIIISYTFISMS